MIRLLELLIALLIVAALFVVVGLFLPSARYAEHALETNRPLRQVYDTVNSFRRFQDWHPLRARDPNVRYTLEGPLRGEGARLVYQSNNPQIGSGALEIVESIEDEKVVIRATNDAYGEDKLHTFVFDDKGKTVEITWSYTVQYGWDLLGRYAGLYINRTVGDDIRVGLGNLIGLFATMPNFDYKSIEIATVDVEPQHLLYVSLKTKRNITAVENAMVEALAELQRAVAANKLEKAAPERLITTNFGSDEYEFDVAIPVRRPVADAPEADAPAADTDAADAEPADGDQVDAIAVDIAPALQPLEGLNLPENVQVGVGYAGPALMSTYEGHPAALPLVRDMLRAYAASHGEVIRDRAFEEYLTPIEDTSGEDPRFNIYWPIAPIDPVTGQPVAQPAAAPAEPVEPVDADAATDEAAADAEAETEATEAEPTP